MTERAEIADLKRQLAERDAEIARERQRASEFEGMAQYAGEEQFRADRAEALLAEAGAELRAARSLLARIKGA